MDALFDDFDSAGFVSGEAPQPNVARPEAIVPTLVDGPEFGSSTGSNYGNGDDLVKGLNPQQRKAVEYRGPALLVVAGAGSGKTRVLTHRIAHLIYNRDAWPSQILAITFTNKAAAEMRERVQHILGDDASGMWLATFHSACVRILRAEAENFGYPQSFSIYDSADSKALLKRILKNLDAENFNITPAKAQSKISRLKNELVDYETYARDANIQDPAEALFIEIFRSYTQELARAKAFDFDDLIVQTVYLFRAYPKIAAKYQRRFRHILVDEYQDTNHAQYSLIQELTRKIEPEEVQDLINTGQYVANLVDANGYIPGASLTVVGDSDQSIYAFRGADIRNISEFERDFPGASTVLLEQNYRSSQTILDAANAVIGNNFDRKAKNLWTDSGKGAEIIGYTGYSGHDEAQFVADQISEQHRDGHPYSEMAVFYRTNAQTRTLEEILIRSGIPYRLIGGTKFYERAEIKDLMAYLTVAVNPADDLALRRIINTPKRGIGPATETQVAKFAEEQGILMADALLRADELGLGPKLRAALHDLGTLINETKIIAANRPPVETLMQVLDRTGYLTLLKESRDPQQEARAENVEELVAQLREYASNNPDVLLLDFLTETALVAAADDLDDSTGTVSLMTLHTAKGLEYDVVFITGIEEGLLPHQMSFVDPGGIAEERRLFYVGITRARKQLHLSLALTRAQYGGLEGAIPSRFINEVPPELISWRGRNADDRSQGSIGAGSSSLSRSGSSGFGYGSGSSSSSSSGRSQGYGFTENPIKPKTTWPNAIKQVRDNSEMELAIGDRIRHVDFGEGRVTGLRGEGPKRVAEVQFNGSGRKNLLVKIAPIEKL
ncbi:MAG: UvrD-helicase domain-containing protein [Microbacteriaceae bacterium]